MESISVSIGTKTLPLEQRVGWGCLWCQTKEQRTEQPVKYGAINFDCLSEELLGDGRARLVLSQPLESTWRQQPSHQWLSGALGQVFSERFEK